jgi:hypothetical protein
MLFFPPWAAFQLLLLKKSTILLRAPAHFLEFEHCWILFPLKSKLIFNVINMHKFYKPIVYLEEKEQKD